MSIWKKFAGLLFEESDAIIADDELEDVTFPEEVVVQKKQTAKKKEVNVAPKPESFYDEELVQTVQPKKVTEEKDPVKKFVSIEVSDEKVAKVKAKAKEVRTERPSNAKHVLEEKKDFEFSPVISPIFGSKDETVVEKGKSTHITLPKKKTQNPLGTVISPYFGFGELEEFKEEAQETIEKKEKSLQEEVPADEIEQYVEADDINSISIDDIIVDKDSEEDEDDMMQISLFGESTPLRDSDVEINK